MLVRTVDHQDTTPVSAQIHWQITTWIVSVTGNTPPTRSNPPVNRPPPTFMTPMTSSLYVSTQTLILLQMARATVNEFQSTLNVRLILDSGSQSTYVTTFIQGTLCLKTLCTETMVIKIWFWEGGKQTGK